MTACSVKQQLSPQCWSTGCSSARRHCELCYSTNLWFVYISVPSFKKPKPINPHRVNLHHTSLNQTDPTSHGRTTGKCSEKGSRENYVKRLCVRETIWYGLGVTDLKRDQAGRSTKLSGKDGNVVQAFISYSSTRTICQQKELFGYRAKISQGFSL